MNGLLLFVPKEPHQDRINKSDINDGIVFIVTSR